MAVQPHAAFPTLVDLLAWRAAEMPSRGLYTFLGESGGDDAALSYGELDARARGIAAMLGDAASPGDLAVLLYPPGLDYIAGFCGCLYAAVVAVPAYPPDPARIERTLPRLRAMVADAGATVILTTRAIQAMAPLVVAQAPELGALRWIASDAPPAGGQAWRRPALGPDTLGFLQYTSGSTGEPKGVMLTHGNLLHNLGLIRDGFEICPDDIGVLWLPPYHDMGLIGGILEPLYAGFEMALMSPVSFLRRPIRWLEAISERRATIAGGPNFAFDLCARKARPAELDRLDLRAWQVAFSGAEPIRAETLDRFCDVFARCGFGREAIYPCYGLAESTLIVSGGRRATPPAVHALDAEALARHRAVPVDAGAPAARAHVGCGRVLPGLEIAIVDPETCERRAPGEVGEIWISGPSVACGYWGKPDDTERAFHARPRDGGAARYLRTGDLGLVLDDGELLVTGRRKDVLIIRGKNHYPQDLERTVEHGHPAVRPGCSAAFSLDTAGGEPLAVVAELSPQAAGTTRDPASLAAIAQAIRRAVSRDHELAIRSVVLVPPGGILKTSSGKIQRRATREALASGSLPVLARFDEPAVVAGTDAEGLDGEAARETDAEGLESGAAAREPGAGTAVRDALAAAPAPERAGLVLALLRAELARALGRDPAQIDPGAAAAALGLDSLGMLTVEGRLEAALAIPVPDALLWRCATLAAAAEELATAWHTGAPDLRPASAGAGGHAAAMAADELAAAWHIGAPCLRPASAGAGGHAAAMAAEELATAWHIGAPDLRPASAGASSGAVATTTELAAAWQASDRSPCPASAGAGSGVAAAETIPVSSGQARLWFLDQLLPGSAVYNVFGALRLSGSLDQAALAHSLTALIERHAVLRTTFAAGESGAPIAVIAPPAPIALAVVEHDRPAEARDAELAALCRAESSRPFDLTVGPLVRATLVRLAGDDHALLLTLHHSVTDGWSMVILTRELAALYRRARSGDPPSLPPAPRHDDHVRRARATAAALDAQRAFWKRTLDGVPRLELPIARPRSGPPSSRGATCRFTLPAELVDRVREIARRRGTTLFAAMLAGVAALLHRYTGQSDFAIGTITANRSRPEHRDMVGFLAQTLVLRVDAARDPSFGELIDRCRRTVSDALAHAELAFDEVVRICRPTSDAGHDPLFQAAFVLESLPPLALDVPGMTWTPMVDLPDGSAEDTAKFDLAVMMAEPAAGGDARLACQYSTDRFDEPAIRRLVGHLEVLLGEMCAAPARPVSSLALLTEPERRQLADWNATAADTRRDATLARLFAEQVARTPGAIAITCGDVALGYAELDRRSSELARRLVASGVTRESRVGLYLERSADLAVGVLGILKAGAAYVPLDPAYPAERIAFVLADARVAAIVADDHLAADLPELGCPVLSPAAAPAIADDPVAPAVDLDPAALAYVMYTSGSTGRPKGVMISHASVVKFCAAMDRRIGAEPPGVFLAVTSVAFDISVLELVWTLTRGFTVVVHTAGHAEPRPASRAAASRPLDLSLFYFAADEDHEGRGGGDRYRLLLDGARFADDHEFCAIWTPERHFHAFGGLYPNPSVTGAAIAATTRRVAIRAGSVVLPLHHPVRVAEDWSLVDNLSGGRVGVSFASGWHANDFALAPERYARRRELLLEGIDLIRRLWRGERATLVNGEGKPVEIGLRPRPVQRELPIWLTAAGNPDTFRAAGELGAGVLTHLLGQRPEDLRDKIAIYRDARRRAGHDGPGQVTLMLHAFVHRDMAVVRAQAAEPFRRYLKSSADLMRSFGKSVGIDIDDASFTEADLDAMVARAHERLFETGGLFGTPRSCEALVARIADIGVDEIACLIDFGVDPDAVLGSLPYLDALRRRIQRPRPAPRTIPEQIAAYGVTHLQCTPSAAQSLLVEPGAERALGGLRALLVGGEALPAPLAAQLSACAPGRVINLYGPTETTIWSASHPVTAGEPGAVIALGTPIDHTALHVLDAQLAPVPVGVPGELYIAGAGLARGYHGRPGLTAERFVPDPFAGGGARMYRTGDLARRRDDGSVDFLGRVDHQVKLRGFRIELGEIEATLAEHPGVREVAVALREDRTGDPRLVAYVVPRGASAPDAEELRGLARRRLPDHMVPAAVVALDAMPMTPNEKLDRARLPAPAAERADLPAAHVAPRTPIEDTVARVFAGLLGKGRVGAHDDFFALGGHSLLAAQLASRLHAMFHVELPVRVVFEARTPARLAEHLAAQATASVHAAPPIAPRAPAAADLPLSFAQQRLWFLEQLDPGGASYHIPFALRLRGALRVDALRSAFEHVVARHEVLRTRFAVRDGRPCQVILPPKPWDLPVIDLSEHREPDRERDVQLHVHDLARQPFALDCGPLLRTALLRLSDREHVLALCMHHIVSDGWSLGVLVDELSALYQALSAGRAAPLPPLAVQYADYTLWQRAWLAGDTLDAQLAYWRDQLAGAAPLDLPTDRPRPALRSQRGSLHGFTLPGALAGAVHQVAVRGGATPFMVLLGSFHVLLWRATGQPDLCVGTPIANRTRPELESLIGLFVNTLVLRADLSGDPSFLELLGQIRDTALGAYAHQDTPFDQIVKAVGVKRELGRSPLIQVMFVLQNAPMPAPRLPGLEVAMLPIETGAAKFDLTLSLMASPHGLEGQLEYAGDLFDRATIAQLAADYHRLLEAITADPTRRIGALPPLASFARRPPPAEPGAPRRLPRRRLPDAAAPAAVVALEVEPTTNREP